MNTQEQMDQLMAMMQEMARAMTIQAQTNTAAGIPVGGQDRERNNNHKRMIDPKAFNRLAKFGKGEDNWMGYNFEFGVILGSESPDMLETLKVLETYADEMGTMTVRAMDEDRANRMIIEDVKGAVRDLGDHHGGRGEGGGEGHHLADDIQVWHRLHRHYDGRTFARDLWFTRRPCARSRCRT